MSSPTFPLRGYPADTPLTYEKGSDKIIAYCAEEVRRQGDSPWHVFRMYEAWTFAIVEQSFGPTLTHALVRFLGSRIDEANQHGYRQGSVWVGGHEKTGAESIHAEMTKLLDEQKVIYPIEFYARFEEIHPFMDGNGRTGKVLYNWLNSTLLDPVWPKDLYGGIENP